MCKFEEVLLLKGCPFYINEFRGQKYFGFDRDILDKILNVWIMPNVVVVLVKNTDGV